MGTIVQEYGPIYGEAVNGTVQGRPNGSVYVPDTNKISIGTVYYYVKSTASRTAFCDSNGVVKESGWHVAESQDLASYVQQQLYSDAECTTLVTSRNLSAGLFNGSEYMYISNSASAIVDGETYYYRAQLMNNGVPVATSDVIELTGWAV